MTPTRYTVIAQPEAEDDLLTLWLNHPAHRAAITQASAQIDRALRQDADQQGASSPTPEEPDRRRIDCDLLRAFFFVSVPDRRVEIVGYGLILTP